MTADRDNLTARLQAIADSQARLADAVETLQHRLDDLSRLMQGVAETSTRLKLMAGNAKERDADAARRLAAIEERLNQISPPG